MVGDIQKNIGDDVLYGRLQEQHLLEWEQTCVKCGACCGVFDKNPCEHLSETTDGKYFCSIYENRLGIHNTANGTSIKCVPIRKILHETWPGDSNCGYKKNYKK